MPVARAPHPIDGNREAPRAGVTVELCGVMSAGSDQDVQGEMTLQLIASPPGTAARGPDLTPFSEAHAAA